jgi:pyruvate carboxylase
VENPDKEVVFPDSVIDMMRGNLGQPPGGFPDAIVKRVLKDEKPNLERPGKHAAPIDIEATRTELAETLGREISGEDLMGYLMYPKVFTAYAQRFEEYGPVRTLPTHAFFYGMEPGEEIEVEIEPGVTLVVRLQAVGETNEEGEARVFFELNGQPRTVRVPNRRAAVRKVKRPKAEAGNTAHLGAPMPGTVGSVAAKAGARVKRGDLLLTIEAMKMETGLNAERDAVIKAVHVAPADQIDAKDLLIEFES